MTYILLLVASLLFTIFFFNVIKFRDVYVFILFICALFIPIVGLVFGIAILGFLPLIAYDCSTYDMICVQTNKFTKWLFNGAYQSNGVRWYDPNKDKNEGRN